MRRILRDYFIFTAFILVFVTAASSQVPREFVKTIEYGQEESAVFGALGFEGAVADVKRDNLPYYVHSFKLPEAAATFNGVFRVIETETVPSTFFSREQLNALPSDFSLEAEIKFGREEAYGEITVFPYRRSAGNTVERITRFSCNPDFTLGSRPARSGNRTAENSVLAQGNWYKIAIADDGVYRINRSFLSDLGIDVTSLNPQSINIYGNGGTQLPYNNSEPRLDDLKKNPIFISGESDGIFGSNDYILFYGKGPHYWKLQSEADPSSIEPNRFLHFKHYYSDSAYYFIRIDDANPLRIANVNSSDEVPTKLVSTFQDRQFLENDINNLARSGREFFGEQFNDIATSFSFNFSAPNALPVPAHMKFQVAGRTTSGSPSSFSVNVDGQPANLAVSNTSVSATVDIVKLARDLVTFVPNDGNISFSLEFNPSNPGAQGWLDYLQLNLTRELRLNGTSLHFRDTTGIAPASIAEFQIANGSPIDFVWDVTDPTEAFSVNGSLEGNTYVFKQSADELREYFAFSVSAAKTPTPIGRVENQNLHALNGVDLVIVCASGLFGPANTLADFHRQEGMDVEVVIQEQVFNEFSSGNRDVTAIKMLMKMLYDRAAGNSDEQPKHLLLFGDGSYNNKLFTGNSRNYIMTYESENSINPVSSIVSDDYFGFLDDNEGEAIQDKMDIGIGRLPVSTISQANNVVSKILNYASANTGIDANQHCGTGQSGVYGSWRNIITFVSDDQDGNVIDGNIHMRHSDEHADSLYAKHNDFDITKIYMDAYRQNSTPGGERYPDAEDAVRRRVQNGALIVNYIGHGGERGWAHERLLTLPTIQSWTNRDRLPLFMTATCELSRFDDPEVASAGELMILNPQGGAIAMLTTTRIVYSASNQRLGRAFYLNVFSGDEPLTLGEITRRTKNDTVALSATTNMRNFTLLGDPALKLSQPKFEVYTEQINGVEISVQDTIRALQEVTVSGFIGDANGNKLSNFNGVIYPTVFDKKQQVVTLDNDNVNPYTYEVFENVIYKGKTSVVNGEFSFSFPVPRDISFAFGTGRISYYAVESLASNDAHGNTESFVIGGTLDGAELNAQGPDIELFMNDESFVFGGTTNEQPILLAKVFDENGINTVGNGIGHDITAVLDGKDEDAIILNDYYEADLDTYQSGQVRYQFDNLSEGSHNLKLKVWDAHNNSSESSLDFIVANNEDLALEHVLNYPNPFTTQTQFFFEHNQSCEFLEVRIQVFTVSGKLVKTIDRTMLNEGFRSEAIAWDGLDDFGDRIGRGVYVYKVEVTNPTGQKAEAFEKLVILR